MGDLAEIFAQNDIVPKIIPNAPKEKFSVQYDGTAVDCGNVFPCKQTRFLPKVTYPADPESLYSFIMIDPDALSREKPNVAEWLHWLVVNIPGNHLIDALIGGQTVMTYTGPTPGARTGLHRYILLLWHQGLERVKVIQPASRSKFKVSAFQEKHKLGDPIAGNFYQSQHEG